LEIRRQYDEPRTFLPCLPDDLAGFDAVCLGLLRLGEHNAMARLNVAAYGHAFAA